MESITAGRGVGMTDETPEQQLLDMAAREEEPKLRELLIATVARKVVADIVRQGKDGEQ
jgi:hypothetical protein